MKHRVQQQKEEDYFDTQIGQAKDKLIVMAKNNVDDKWQQSATKSNCMPRLRLCIQQKLRNVRCSIQAVLRRAEQFT